MITVEELALRATEGGRHHVYAHHDPSGWIAARAAHAHVAHAGPLARPHAARSGRRSGLQAVELVALGHLPRAAGRSGHAGGPSLPARACPAARDGALGHG